MTKFKTGASRDTGGKGRCDLLPHSALLRVSRQMEGALAEHEERNWERGIPMHSFLDSAMRHLFKYMDGWVDEDHLAAAATNVLMALWTEDHMPEMQDIPTRPEYDEYLSFRGLDGEDIRHTVSEYVRDNSRRDPDGGGDSDLFKISSHDPGHGSPSYVTVGKGAE